MILADTGFFVALAQARDDLHNRALAWARAVSEPIVVTEHVVWETVNYLSALVDRPKGHVLVNHVHSAGGYEFVAASLALYRAGLKLHAERTDKDWSLTGCISFVVMQERSIVRALSYDHHFEQADFEALLRRDPS